MVLSPLKEQTLDSQKVEQKWLGLHPARLAPQHGIQKGSFLLEE